MPSNLGLYEWPHVTVNNDTDRQFKEWVDKVWLEISPVIAAMQRPLPDDPVLVDEYVTQNVEGWAPRVAALATTAEWWLQQAKSEKWPEKLRGADGKPLTTDKDRDAEYEGLLKDYRFIRNYLDTLVAHMRERMRWAQSVRKQHAVVQDAGSYSGF